MFYIFQISVGMIFLLLLSSKIKKKQYRIILSIASSLLILLEISAVYMTETFIDYRFYNHMNLSAILTQGFQFLPLMLLFALIFIVFSMVYYELSKRLNDSIVVNNKYFISGILFSIILLNLQNGILNEKYEIYEFLTAEEKSFNEALIDLGITAEEYILPNQLTSEKGKNIIVIAIESLEKGFLGKNFDNITPNLTKLSKEWTFYNMPQSPGGNWTAASLYNYQVGMPAFFKGQANELFQETVNVKLVGLGHVLNKAGYNSRCIVGNAEFAGKSDLLSAYNIPVVSQDNVIGQYPKVPNGLHDYDLFQEAKLQIKELKKNKNKPFALFLLTVNTHFPKGIYDKRMEKFISPKDNCLEFAVSSVDYLVNDFIQYIKESNLLYNTSIYIFPDHLLMGSCGSVYKKLKKSPRELYLLTNEKVNKLHKNVSDTVYQIDLPRIIIDGAEIKTNATFLVDFIKDKNINKFLEKNRVKLTTLNTASVLRKDYMQGIDINIVDNKLSIQTDADSRQIFLFLNNIKEEVFDFTFNSEMVLIDQDKTNPKYAFNLNYYDKQYKRLHLLVFIKNGKITQSYLGDKQAIGLYKNGEKNINYSEKNVKKIVNLKNANDIWFF